jgi:hypothetical protein
MEGCVQCSGATKCAKGQIRRKSYSARRKSTKKKYRVKSTCIKDVGLPGRGKKLFDLTPGLMKAYGYTLDVSDTKRHSAIKKAVKKEGYATVVRRINALSVLHRNTNPQYHKLLEKDKKFIKQRLQSYSNKLF